MSDDFVQDLLDDEKRLMAIEAGGWTVERFGEAWQIWSSEDGDDIRLLATSEDIWEAIDEAIKATTL